MSAVICQGCSVEIVPADAMPVCAACVGKLDTEIARLTRERDEARRELEEIKEKAAAWEESWVNLHVIIHGILDDVGVPGKYADGSIPMAGLRIRDLAKQRDQALARLTAAEKVVEAARELFDALYEKNPDWWDYVTSGNDRSEDAWEGLSAALDATYDTAKSGEGE